MYKTFTLILSFLCLAFLTQAQTDGQDFIVTGSGSSGSIGEITWSGANFSGAVTQSFCGDVVWGFAETLDTDTAMPIPGTSDSLCCTMPLLNPDEIAGNICMIRRGACFFADKIFYAQEAGAIAVIIVNHLDAGDPNEQILMGTGGDFGEMCTIPAIFASYATGETLIAALENDAPLNVCFDLPVFLRAVGAFAYSTPQSQIVPLNQISVQIVNRDTVVALDQEVSVAIENPSGDVTLLTETVDLPSNENVEVVFEEYLPTEMGTYSLSFENTHNEMLLTNEFEITDYTFAIDDGIVDGEMQDAVEGFTIGANFINDYGSYFRAGPNGGTATHVTFAIANPDSIYTGDPNNDVFNIIIWKAIPDGTGEVPATQNYDEMQFVGEGIYVLTGSETPNQLIDVALLSPLTLEPNGQYVVSVRWDAGDNLEPIAPAFVTAGTREFPSYSSTVYWSLDNTMFAAELHLEDGLPNRRNILIRLQLDGYVATIKETTLADDQFSIVPNITSDQINLNLDLDQIAKNSRVIISDTNGNRLLDEAIKNAQFETINYNVSNYPAGTYFLTFFTEKGMRTEKFVVIR